MRYTLREVATLVPGLILTSAVAWLGIVSSEWLGTKVLGFTKSPISGIMMAIVFGLFLGNLAHLPKWLEPGIRFSLKKVLRLGIVLLGLRLSIGDVLKLSALGIPIVIFCIVGALLLTQWLGRRLQLPSRLSTLIGVGTSICGASAIVATGPAIDAGEEEITYAVANITIFGILAMFLYPYLARLLFANSPVGAGLFLGTSIHETAQVAGAGLIYSGLFDAPQTLNAATVAKLVRNLCMVFVIPAMSFWCRRRTATQEGGQCETVSIMSLVPLFILGFLAMAVIRSIGDATFSSGRAFGFVNPMHWQGFTGFVQVWAGNFLAVAMAGVGLGTSLRKLKGLGLRPFYVGLGSAVAVGVLSILGLLIMQGFGLG